jgi:lysophospholipase L1-like esterase
MKIVFFGDSLTWGGYGGSFVAEIKELLPDHEIINAGAGGNTVVNLLRRLDDDVLAHEPEGVFVMVGGNDALSYSQPETRPYYRRSQSIPDGVVDEDTFTKNYRELLNRLQLARVQTWIGLPPAEYNPEMVETLRRYNNHAREIAQSMNLPVLDLMEKLVPEDIAERPDINLRAINNIGERQEEGWDDYTAERERNGFTFSFDGVHFTPETAQRVARLVAEFLDL